MGCAPMGKGGAPVMFNVNQKSGHLRHPNGCRAHKRCPDGRRPNGRRARDVQCQVRDPQHPIEVPMGGAPMDGCPMSGVPMGGAPMGSVTRCSIQRSGQVAGSCSDHRFKTDRDLPDLQSHVSTIHAEEPWAPTWPMSGAPRCAAPRWAAPQEARP